MQARYVARLGLLLAATLAMQMVGLPQPLTGPAVNGMLIMATLFVGPWGAVAIGVLTPWVAFLRGILPTPLGPAIPFITAGNAALVLVYALVYRLSHDSAHSVTSWGSCAGLVAGAIAKYLVLTGSVRFLLDLPPQLSVALSLPQLFTALIGGAVALPVARALIGLGVKEEEMFR